MSLQHSFASHLFLNNTGIARIRFRDFTLKTKGMLAFGYAVSRRAPTYLLQFVLFFVHGRYSNRSEFARVSDVLGNENLKKHFQIRHDHF